MKEHELLELLESTDFELLSETDKELVLFEMTVEEYQQRRKVIQEANLLFEEADNCQPKPFVLPDQKSTFMTATVPLYQALLAIAAVVVVMLSIFPFFNATTGASDYVVAERADTVKTTVVQYDTVEVIVEKPVVEKQIVYVEIPAKKEENLYPNRLLNVPQSLASPNLEASRIQTKGTPLTHDTTNLNLPSVN